MNKITTNINRFTAIAATVLFIAAISACNKDFPSRLKDASGNDTVGISAKTRKVLYIIVDGARGRAIKSINPPNIARITKNSIYALDALNDYNKNTMTNAGAWASMITGVGSDKHGVISEDFAGNKLTAYPSVFTRLKQANAKLRTISIAASGAFNANFSADATVRQNFENNDVSVKNAVKEELMNGDAALVVGQFHSAELAAKASNYETYTPEYANAILQIDNYIGEIMAALSSRKTFSNENWLVVIASNKGGVITADPASTDLTQYGDQTRNNFVIFYNPRFSTLFIPKPNSDQIPYVGASVQFNYTERPTAIVTDVNAYNFGVNGNYTIELLIKSKEGSYIYPTFLSKRAASFTGAGWNMFLEFDKWTLNSSVANQAQGGVVSDGKWHKLTAVFDGTNKKVRVYTDGVLNTERDMSTNNMNNTAPFKIGYNAGDGNTSANVLVNSLQVYNVALTSQEISNYSCKTIVAPTNPHYGNLIGYWPLNEGTGTTIKDISGKGKDLLMGGSPVWENFSDAGSLLCPEINDSYFRLVPNNVDIPFELYQWLGISIPLSWNLDGKAWNPIYSDIKP
ncbi:hypothetical protein DBR43_24650 [Pedobacter sp. KBW06]|uniref:LamG-like jellyroll fold domain-containing protein n=1 Tax=Pedobacter sp. KBW06 TaxID=2153359 RepID=UPI000F59CB15|nr:LamG-like jellyroll fold domain-containing protein [Pedobacter sp. KBW06]RQO67713.1 hypothetical protein DBR43_24650 [Pedobacter sp. KBW06]